MMSSRNTLKLAITGGIGSGKSYVTALLKKRHIPIYNNDAEAKRLMMVSSTIRESLCSLVSSDVYCSDGTLNRTLLAEWMFASSERVEQVNALVHPVVKEDFLRWSSQQDAPIVVMECAILFESGFDALVDKVLLVTAPEQVRIERVMKRDNVSAEQVLARIAAQMSDKERSQKADYILNNDGDGNIEIALSTILNTIENELLSY